MITPDCEMKVAASDIGYPNGIEMTPDGKHLLVAETFSATVSIFDVTDNGRLINQKAWVQFDDLGFSVRFDEQGVPEDLSRHYPDGICYDEKQHAVWVTSPGKNEVLCIDAHGQCLRTIKTRSRPFDCVLGGNDKQTLYIATSDASEESRTGKIERIAI